MQKGHGDMTKDRNSARASMLYGLIIGIMDVCVLAGVILISDYNRSLGLLAFLLLVIVFIRIPICSHRHSNSLLITMGSALLAFLLFGFIMTYLTIPARLERLLGITSTSFGDGSAGLMLLFFDLMIVVLDIIFITIALLKRCIDSHVNRYNRELDSR